MNQAGAREQRQTLRNLDPAAQLLRQLLRVAMHRGRSENLAVEERQGSMRRPAKVVRLLQYRVEYGGKVGGQRIDDLQDLGGRGLLRQSLTRLGQEPRILHRDDRLRREVFEQR